MVLQGSEKIEALTAYPVTSVLYAGDDGHWYWVDPAAYEYVIEGAFTAASDGMNFCSLCGSHDGFTMVDFMAYDLDGTGYVSGGAHNESITDGIWNQGAFFDSSAVSENETISRDGYSTDTDQPADWDDDGGVDAGQTTQGWQNIPEFEDFFLPVFGMIAPFRLCEEKERIESNRSLKFIFFMDLLSLCLIYDLLIQKKVIF